jgi:hypothetical protein
MDYFCKFKTFISYIRACKIDKKDEQLFFSILTKLGPEYSVYTSYFHTTRLDMGSTCNIPSIYEFMESFIHEQTNPIQIGHSRVQIPMRL